MKYNILFISPYVPFDKVGHAGGKTHNYYIKKFNSDANFNVKLITFGSDSDKTNIDLDKYNIDYKITYKDSSLFHRLVKLIFYNFSFKFNPFDKNGGMLDYYDKHVIINNLKKLKEDGYKPDVIVLEWTQIVLMLAYIKEIYPYCIYVASEHDVSYLSFYRKYKFESKLLKKFIRFIKYKILKKTELRILKEFNLVLPHNIKDRNMLIKEKIDKSAKIDYIHPYYSSVYNLKPNYSENNIIFFGSMDRVENYESCIWFIENVFNKIIKFDNTFKFFIVGSKPNKKLLEYSSKNIIITGFVEDIKPYFENALCMVAPLILGAGIKVKVLEGMSSGIPVLTNDIGIEGIPAKESKDFILCKDPNDYLSNIIDLSNDKDKAKIIGTNGRKFIDNNFNLESSYEKYRNNILKLLEINKE